MKGTKQQTEGARGNIGKYTGKLKGHMRAWKNKTQDKKQRHGNQIQETRQNRTRTQTNRFTVMTISLFCYF